VIKYLFIQIFYIYAFFSFFDGEDGQNHDFDETKGNYFNTQSSPFSVDPAPEALLRRLQLASAEISSASLQMLWLQVHFSETGCDVSYLQ